ncbi:MAG TPA: polysaccharide biosynthesis C-terminal domain-containing protein [bacterium]|nr:polysaccharide biosynthesis C-terminal domain-containing protein [bacterium]HPQ66975.1 polysaccharide biosynthesis C-terminal domain-containing protein [bacterium]
MTGDRNSVASNAAALLVSRVLRMAVSLGVALLLARHLGPKLYGDWTVANSLCALAAVWLSLGMEKIAIRAAVRDPASSGRYFGAVFCLRILAFPFYLAVILSVGLVMGWSGRLIPVLAVLAGVYFLNTLGEAGVIAWRSRERMWYEAAVGAGKDLLLLGMVLLLTVRGADLIEFAGGYLAVALVWLAGTLILIYLIFFSPRPVWDLRLFRFLVLSGFPVAVAVFCNGFQDLSRVLIEHLLGPRAAGYFGAAGLPLKGLEILAVSLMGAIFPGLSRQGRGGGDDALVLAAKAGKLFFLAGLPFVFVSMMLSPRIMGVLFGEDYLPGAGVLAVLGSSSLFLLLNHLCYGMMVATGRERLFAVIMFAAAAANALLVCILVSLWGMMGGAWAFFLVQMAVLAAFLRILGPRFRRAVLPRERGRLLAAAAAAAGVVWVLKLAGLGLWAAAGAGTVVYLSAAAVSGALDKELLRAAALVRNLKGKR